MFISTKKEYLLTDSVCIAGLNKKRIKTTENNGIGHLNTGSVPVVWILHFSMKLFWETKLQILAFVNKRRSDLPKTDRQQFDHSFLIRHDRNCPSLTIWFFNICKPDFLAPLVSCISRKLYTCWWKKKLFREEKRKLCTSRFTPMFKCQQNYCI